MIVDLFTSYKNSKCSRFNSKYLYPSTEAVNWSNQANWLVPPIDIIPKCLKNLSTSGPTWIFMPPSWLSATFWPLPFENKNRFVNIIQDALYLPRTVLELGDYKGSFIGSKAFDS